jgi:cobalt-zinc-cadmium efflux system protein
MFVNLKLLFYLHVTFLAFHFDEKPATAEKTHGFKRFEILAALINGLTLIGISLYILFFGKLIIDS